MTTCTPRAAWGNLLRRLHFYIGLFVGPFIFFAALYRNAVCRHAAA